MTAPSFTAHCRVCGSEQKARETSYLGQVLVVSHPTPDGGVCPGSEAPPKAASPERVAIEQAARAFLVGAAPKPAEGQEIAPKAKQYEGMIGFWQAHRDRLKEEQE